ncbi:MAG: SDR family oxidoreductase [Chloroflexi bacterium]|nr:SDR family oxidoreductase [Chloroflexota bacterium]
MNDLQGKVALVTGAARQRGIGRAVALRLASEGADVVVTGKHRPVEEFPEWEKESGWLGLESVVRELEASGRRSLAIVADVTRTGEVSEVVKAVVEKFGRIDILVNNAGVVVAALGRRTPAIDLDEGIWERTLATNLTGPFLFSKAVGKLMVGQGKGGKIVNIASDMAKTARVGSAAYAASKHGLIGLTRAMALELAPYKINVNAVCPGPVMTDPGAGALVRQEAADWGISFEAARKRHYDEAGAVIPLARAATAEDVASVVLFLASSQSDYMTGQAINVTGGRITY